MSPGTPNMLWVTRNRKYPYLAIDIRMVFFICASAGLRNAVVLGTERCRPAEAAVRLPDRAGRWVLQHYTHNIHTSSRNCRARVRVLGIYDNATPFGPRVRQTLRSSAQTMAGPRSPSAAAAQHIVWEMPNVRSDGNFRVACARATSWSKNFIISSRVADEHKHTPTGREHARRLIVIARNHESVCDRKRVHCLPLPLFPPIPSVLRSSLHKSHELYYQATIAAASTAPHPRPAQTRTFGLVLVKQTIIM